MPISIVLELPNNWRENKSSPAIQEDECVVSTAPEVECIFKPTFKAPKIKHDLRLPQRSR
jgi:hypothetical protein